MLDLEKIATDAYSDELQKIAAGNRSFGGIGPEFAAHDAAVQRQAMLESARANEMSRTIETRNSAAASEAAAAKAAADKKAGSIGVKAGNGVAAVGKFLSKHKVKFGVGAGAAALGAGGAYAMTR